MLFQSRTNLPAILYVEVDAEDQQDAEEKISEELDALRHQFFRLGSMTTTARCTGVEFTELSSIRNIDEFQTEFDFGLGRDNR
jgi:hypothetical protein